MNSPTSPDTHAPECAATHPAGFACTRPAGHEGDHQDARSEEPATLNWGPEATARLAAANSRYPTTTLLPADAPDKVRRAVLVIERNAYSSPERAPLLIRVEHQDNAYGGLWFITAERYPGTLAATTLHVGVSGRGRGRLLTTRQWSAFGKARERRGWAGLRSLAALT